MEELLLENHPLPCTTMIAADRRQAERTRLSAQFRLLVMADFKELTGDVLDVSRSGMGVVTSRAFGRHTSCMVAFDIDCRGRRTRINATGIVVASSTHTGTSYRTGIQFLDMDSRSQHLLDCFVRHRCGGAGCGAGLSNVDL